MFDILLEGMMQSFLRHRWWIAVTSGAFAALLFVGVLHFAGILPA